MRPQTQFTKSGDVTIAYQVSGKGPIDLVYAPGWLTNIEYEWENPRYAHFFQLLGSFARLIRFDKRGTGMSDRELGYPTLEQRMDDVRAVMDATGSERASIFCMSEGGFLGTLFAATYPERAVALVLLGCFARSTWAPDYPFKPKREDCDVWLDDLERDWGGPFDLSDGAPSVAHEEWARQWFAAYLRFGASPGSAIEFTRFMLDVDVRDILPSVRVPTLVLQRLGDRWAPPGNGRYLAEHIPDATLVELTGDDHLIWAGDYERIVAETQAFLTGMRAAPPPERTLLTILMTDIVSSTATAAKLGDHSWRHLLEQHNAIVRGQVNVHGGREVKTTGDGFLLTFDGPTAAIACANSTHDKLKPLGLKIRAGIHTGECERLGEDLSGIAVHIASRILDRAQPDSTWVSSTVKDLVVGSGIEFTEKGTESLKGVPGTWTLFSVSS